jgi:hypothetical protein
LLAELAIFNRVKGIFLFGTPHDGLLIEDIQQLVDRDSIYKEKTEYLFMQLKEGSEFLENQKTELCKIWNKIPGRVFTFYETQKTSSVIQVRLFREHATDFWPILMVTGAKWEVSECKSRSPEGEEDISSTLPA